MHFFQDSPEPGPEGRRTVFGNGQECQEWLQGKLAKWDKLALHKLTNYYSPPPSQEAPSPPRKEPGEQEAALSARANQGPVRGVQRGVGNEIELSINAQTVRRRIRDINYEQF